ncbi:hypothetical protein N2W54_005142 [Lotmaria passim]
MGCKFSLTKNKESAPPPKSSLKSDRTQESNISGNSSAAKQESPAGTSPQNSLKRSSGKDLAATDDNALEDDESNNMSPRVMQRMNQPMDDEDDDDDDNDSDRNHEGSGGMDLNGSFANADLNGSFHIHYNTKGDIIPNATLPESRRGRSVPAKLLAALSPHPSDDDLVLVCTDCGMTIDENCEQLCPLTGKLHV